MTLLVRALGLIPLPLLYIWGWLAFGITFYLVRWRRDQVEHDVALSLAGRPPAERARIVRDSYLHGADTVIEMLWGFGASSRAILRRVVFENPEVVLRLAAEHKTVVLLTPHYCNWEWLFLAGGAPFRIFDRDGLSAPPGRLDRPVPGHARVALRGPAHSAQGIRLRAHERPARPRVYSLIADQTPKRHERKHWTKFLGRDTAFYTGADQVTRFLDATVLYVAMRRVSRGHYAVRVEILAEPPYDTAGGEVIMEKFARRAEQAILEKPEDFLWLQKRWKYPRSADE